MRPYRERSLEKVSKGESGGDGFVIRVIIEQSLGEG